MLHGMGSPYCEPRPLHFGGIAMMKNRLFLSSIAALVAVSCFAAGTVTESTTKLGTVTRYEYTYTLGTNSTASGTTSRFNGEIVRVVSSPTTAGAQDFTVTLKDATISHDVVSSVLANCSSNAVTEGAPGIQIHDGVSSNAAPMYVNDTFTLEVSSIDTGTTGRVIIYVRP